jgi:hypothetical protein
MNLEQIDTISSFESLGHGAWTVVYESWYEERAAHGGIYCAVAPVSKRLDALGGPGWNITKGDFRPGFIQHWESDEYTTTYQPGGVNREFEPLILVREYYGVAPRSLELVEEFRLYHNLYWNESTKQFMQARDDGQSSVAVKVSGLSRVEIRTQLLKQYQAARQMDLVLFIDSVRYGTESDPEPEEREWATDRLRAGLFPSRTTIGELPFTRYLGTRVIPPLPLERAGIWPFEGSDDHFPDFIIEIDENGDEIHCSCNHEALANNFGANPEAPHYLTPVHFRREVLQKYYENPELYTVSDGYLECGSLWRLQIDNSAEDSVVVFLGDLGRDLPKQERDYWRSFNIPPESPVSQTLVRRAFLNQFAEPTAIDLQVRSKYVSLRKAWNDRYGWDLLREPNPEDAGLLQRLRVPLNDTQSEFETSVRIMTQLFIDAINEGKLDTLLTARVKDEKGISKLKRWFEQERYPHAGRDIKFLRDLQELRSIATAHRKASSYQTAMTKILGDLRGSVAARVLFGSAFKMLDGLIEWTSHQDG